MKSKGNHWEASRPKYCFGSELQGGPPGVLVGICACLSGFLTFFPDHYYKRVVMHDSRIIAKGYQQTILDW